MVTLECIDCGKEYYMEKQNDWIIRHETGVLQVFSDEDFNKIYKKVEK